MFAGKNKNDDLYKVVDPESVPGHTFHYHAIVNPYNRFSSGRIFPNQIPPGLIKHFGRVRGAVGGPHYAKDAVGAFIIGHRFKSRKKIWELVRKQFPEMYGEQPTAAAPKVPAPVPTLEVPAPVPPEAKVETKPVQASMFGMNMKTWLLLSVVGVAAYFMFGREEEVTYVSR